MKKIFIFLIIINSLNSQILKKIEEEIQEIYKKINPSLFELKFKNLWITGFTLDKERIITILPYVEEDESIIFFDKDGNKYRGEIEGWDEFTRIAVIKTTRELKIPEFAEFDKNLPKIALAFSLKGKGSFLILPIYEENNGKILIETKISPSFSGAPIVNHEGKIIGILRGAKIDFELIEKIEKEKLKEKLPLFYYQFSLPHISIGYTYDYIKKRVNLIKERGKVYEGFLGILVDFKEGEGIKINKVLRDSPAEKAGLKEDDIIVSYNEKKYWNVKDFINDVKSTPSNSEVKMEIKRDGKIKSIIVKVGKKEKKFKLKREKRIRDLLKIWIIE
ncbi:MAG: S1C family serine protease [Candidatus Hydrothermales bacterium]